MNRGIGRKVGVAVIAVGLVWYAVASVVPRYHASTTDFGRDLAGARAIEVGVQPYQPLGELASQVPDLEVSEFDRDKWVAHSPVSLAAARAMLRLAGNQADSIAAIIVVVGTLGLVGAIALFGIRSGNLGAWLTLGGAVLLSVGVEQDRIWVQGASLLALLLGGTLVLAAAGHHKSAVLLLGLAVAWRPWCAPLALFLPDAKRPIYDAFRVGVIAVMMTVAVAPLVGGFGSLVQWVGVAVPENAFQYVSDPWNLGLADTVGPLSIGLGAVGLFALALFTRYRVDPSVTPRIGATASLAWLPLVWPHYWIGLLPWLMPDRESDKSQPLILAVAFLGLAVPLAGRSPGFTRAGSLLALGLAVVGIVLSVREQRAMTSLKDLDVGRSVGGRR